MTALNEARTRRDWDYCLVMDSDLQHPPAQVKSMLALAEKTGVNIVDGVKAARGKEPLAYRLCAGIFYRLLYALCGVDMRASSDFKLLDRVSVERLCELKAGEPFFRGMCEFIGGRHVAYEFSVEPRVGDASRFTKRGLMRFALSAVLSGGAGPLRFLLYFGGAAAVIGLGGIIAALLAMLWVSGAGLWLLAALVVFFGGITVSAVGLVGEYAARACADAAGRPQFIVGERTDEND